MCIPGAGFRGHIGSRNVLLTSIGLRVQVDARRLQAQHLLSRSFDEQGLSQYGLRRQVD